MTTMTTMNTMTTIPTLTMPFATLTGPETFLLVWPEIALVGGAIVAYLAGRPAWLTRLTSGSSTETPAAKRATTGDGSSTGAP